MEAQVQKHIPISLITIQTKARNIFEEVTAKCSERVKAFSASSGVL
jgi:hypothetical protein